MDTLTHVKTLAQEAQTASVSLRTTSSAVKNAALVGMADALVARASEIFAANAADLLAARERGLEGPLLDRLRLTEKKMFAIAAGCRAVAALPDPIGRLLGGETRPNGLRIEQVRVPLGVVAVIYESRPNVTVDAAILALKAGNAVILRGGSEAFLTNQILAQIISEAADAAGVPPHAIGFVTSRDRAASALLATLDDYVDLIIPRGGNALKQALSEVATVPVIYAAGGTCHVYVDQYADVEMATDIVHNAKVSNPSVCNAAETLLVHAGIANQFLPAAAKRLQESGVRLLGDAQVRDIVPQADVASEEDWGREFLDLTLAVAVVDSLDAALEHISRYGTAHSEAIVTNNFLNAERFLSEVDAAAVYVNASTRFTDGFEFGLGAEVGISTQKLHARGPMGLDALTTTKFLVRGNGQIR